MKKLCCGEITEGNRTVFSSFAALDDEHRLVVQFDGVIRVADPYPLLCGYLKELKQVLPQLEACSALVDFVKMRFCNSNGFYVVLDILEAVYGLVPGSVTIRRLAEDDWQVETLPILLRALGEDTCARTIFDNVE